MGILAWLIMGIIAGTGAKLLLRLVRPDLARVGKGAVIPLGMFGAILGGFIFSLLLGEPGLSGFNLLSLGISIVGATVILLLYGLFMNRLHPSSGGANISMSFVKDGFTTKNQSRNSTSRPPAKYDVFISYRRQHGADTARLIRNALKDQELCAFLDIDELRAGHFDQDLLSHIANTPHFIIILTPHALDRCVEEQDWLRKEITQAIKTKRNIVPVMMPGFEFPEPQALPADIRDLRTYQSVGYSHEFFEAMVDRIIRYIR